MCCLCRGETHVFIGCSAKTRILIWISSKIFHDPGPLERKAHLKMRVAWNFSKSHAKKSVFWKKTSLWRQSAACFFRRGRTFPGTFSFWKVNKKEGSRCCFVVSTRGAKKVVSVNLHPPKKIAPIQCAQSRPISTSKGRFSIRDENWKFWTFRQRCH